MENELGVYGRWIDPSGDPVAGAKVKALPADQGAVKAAADSDSVVTDAKGRYAFKALGKGHCNLLGEYQSGALVVLVPDVNAPGDAFRLDVGTDTLLAPGKTSFTAPMYPGGIKALFRVIDDDGNVSQDTVTVSVMVDPPTAFAGTDTNVAPGDKIALHGKGSDGFGRIAKWEWDVGGLGMFRLSGPDTTVTAPADPVKAFRCILRVTDDDGQVGLDTVQIQIPVSRLLPPSRFVDFFRPPVLGALFGDQLVFAGGRNDSEVVFIDTDTTWQEKPALPGSYFHGCLIEAHGRLFYPGASGNREVASIDGQAAAWKGEPPRLFSRRSVSAVVAGSAIFIAGGDNTQERMTDAFEQYLIIP